METIKQNGFLKMAMNLFVSRPARNIYFWTGYFLNFYQNADEFKYGAGTKFLLLSGIILFLCTAFYLNNLWLLPKYFKKKLYGAYFLRFAILLLVSAIGLVAINYFFDKHFHLENFSGLTMVSLDSGNIYQQLQQGIDMLPILLFGALVAMAFFFFFFFMAWFMNDYFVQQKRLEQALKEKLETDLALIKYQISPHFLFNTLNNLYGMSLIKSENLSKSLLDLASILRYILYESATDEIHFEEEKKILEAYIQLELLRLHKTENLFFKIGADANYKLPPLLWLPVLENIFKHATRHIANEHYVDFNLTVENNIWIIDSKNTFKLVRDHKSLPTQEVSGMGLQNLRKRLEICYPGKYQLIEKAESNLYSIFIKIDLNA